MRSIIHRAAERPGLKLTTVYSLRHSRPRSILDAGHRLEDVAACLRHRGVSAAAAGSAQVRIDRVQELTLGLGSPVPVRPAVKVTKVPMRKKQPG